MLPEVTVYSVPTFVIGGYLGSGKTTLVNHLIRDANGLRIAVLVNDFGDVSIDADLIQGQEGSVLSLAGGCVCCSFGSDLVGALKTVAQRTPQPDLILIEASGVGLPLAIARTAKLVADLSIQAIVVLADAQSVQVQAQDRYVGDIVLQQLREADLLLLSKTDGVDDQTRGHLLVWLACQNSKATLTCISKLDSLPLTVLHNQKDLSASAKSSPWVAPLKQTASAEKLFSSLLFRPEGLVDLVWLKAQLTASNSGVIRAKGVITGLDGIQFVIQCVGSHFEAIPLEKSSSGANANQLVIIGLSGRLNPDLLRPKSPGNGQFPAVHAISDV